MTATPQAVPRPSAVLVLARAGEMGNMQVFMVRRHGQSPFMPDVYVFPGGSVHAADQEAERRSNICMPPADPALPIGAGFRVAAIRECFEEAGVLLAYHDGAMLAISATDRQRFARYRDAMHQRGENLTDIAVREDLVLATDVLLHWAHWITPEGLPRRFDTHFFLAEMPSGQETDHDAWETTDGVWIAPGDALARQDQNQFPLAFPTIRQLRVLAGLNGMAAARERFAGKPVLPIQPTLSASGQEIVLDEA